MSRFGLAADQVLEWEVVLADGELLSASPTNNSDMYWALSGGGGDTFGVVFSMTSRAHPDEPTAAANLTFTNTGVTQSAYYEAIETFLGTLPALVDAGGVSVFLFTNTTFSMTPSSALGLNQEALNDILSPTINILEKNHLNYSRSRDIQTTSTLAH